MKFLNNMKIGKRLGIGFGIIIILIVAIITVGFVSIMNIDSQFERIIKVNNAKIKMANEMLTAIDNLMLAVAVTTFAKDPAVKKKEKDLIDQNRATYKKAIEELKKLEVNKDGQDLITKAEELIGSTREANNKALALSMQGKGAEAASIFEREIKPVADKMGAAIGKIVEYQEGRSLMRYDAAMKSSFMARIVFLSIGLLQIILAVILGIFITRSITWPVSEGVGFAGKMADGDLTHQLEIQQKDEIGVLAASLNDMGSRLRGMFKDIAQGVHTMTASSTELSAISAQMSQGSEQTSGKANMVATAAEEMNSNMASVAAAMEQASTNIHTVASATEEMTATIGEISKNTDKARNITATAVDQSTDINKRINELGVAANEIGKITEAITAISAQTNLLALNATIEAARAGAAGKGFAVVANEIKELAQQTAQATEDIKNKIGGIQGSTSAAVGDIQKISQTIQDVNEIVTTIAAAIEEQTIVTKDIASNVAQAASGIEEVNRNVAQSSTVSGNIAQEIAEVNQAAGEMSASSSQVRISAEELSKVAENIQAMVSKFKV